MQTPSNYSATHQAFTLVEMLVVSAVIGVLAALMLPAVDSALAHAASVQSINNLKQFGAAYMSYAAENDGLLPPAACAISNPSGFGATAYKKGWDYWLLPYLGHPFEGDLTDANRPAAENLFLHKRDKNTGTSGFRRTYAANMLGVTPVVSKFTTTQCGRLLNVKQPSKLILLSEFPYSSGVIGKSSGAFISPCVQISGTKDKRNLNPGSAYNYLFVDGHIESLKVEQTYRAKDDGYRTSYNGGPVPPLGTGTDDLWRNLDLGGGANGADGESPKFGCYFCTQPW